MNKVLTLATALATGIFASLAHPADHYELSPHIGPPETQTLGGSNIAACGDAPGCDPSVEISGRSTGAITVTSVWINGMVVDPTKYSVTKDETSSPEVTFHVPDPGTPGAGDEVCIYGTTTQGDAQLQGKLTW